jgi:hypothetical protein
MTRSLILAVAAAAVLTAGCADNRGDCWDQRTEPSAIRGEERPVKIQPSHKQPKGLTYAQLEKAVPRPAREGSVTEQVLRDLRQETLLMANAIGRTDPGRCDGDVAGSVGSTTRCTITYERMKVQWLVKITKVEPWGFGNTDYQYTARPLTGVVTARQVYDAFARKVWSDYHRPMARCDRIPKLFTAKVGQNTGYRCQELSWSCHDGDNDFEWRDWHVRLDEEGGYVTFA